MTHALSLEGFNPEQAEAVAWPGGPLLVFAGAGSGKTRVIAGRIARLIASGIYPSRILAVTFTNKAAREMRERVEHMAGAPTQGLWIGTFHGMCARMLRMDGLPVGVDPNFTIYDDADQMQLIREVLKEKNLDEKSFQPRSLLNAISNAKEKMIAPKAYAAGADDFFTRVASEVYEAYDARLRKAGALDFDDILYYAVQLLETQPDVAERYQERFVHVLVDEYQDVNQAQYRFVKLIGAKHRNITVVGDDDQSIYAWRGADVGLILKFAADYPDAKVVKLEQNYRSTQTILGAAYEVVRKNRSRADKRLWTDNGAGDKIEITLAGTEQEEARLVADAIMRERRDGRRFADCAILYRTNAQSRAFEEALMTLRIPHVLVGGVRFYDRKEIKDMLAYLRLTLNPNDDVAFRRIVNVPARSIGPSAMSQIEAWAAARSSSLFSAARDQGFLSGLGRSVGSKLARFVRAIEEAAKLAQNGPVTPVLIHLLNESGYLDMLRESRTEESIGRLENLQELVNVTTRYDQGDEVSLVGFLEGAALISDADTIEEGGDAVTLMTLHTAKGLEFPVVFMVGMEEGVFPHSRSLGSDREIEEERRLCYVGMTRAKEKLHLFHAHRRSIFGQPSFNRRSRFLDDIPLELVQSSDGMSHLFAGGMEIRADRDREYRVIESATPKREELWTPPFQVGQRVRHGKFGEGVVIACSPVKADVEVTVAFPGVTGVKKLLQSFAKLEPVL